MEKVLLQEGDFIQFKKGIQVMAFIPKKYVCDYASRGELTEVPITIGEIFEKKSTGVDKVLETFVNFVKTSTILKDSIKKKIVDCMDSLGLDFYSDKLDTSIYAGNYRVYQALYDGEECAAFFGSSYGPDGWHVYCEKVDNPDIKIHFYQTGCFATVKCNML